MTYGPLHTTTLAEGYTAGYTNGEGVYLIVPSSAHVSRLLFPTREAAAPRLEWLRARTVNDPANYSIRKVARTDAPTIFRILD